MKYVIINADDYGLTAGVTYGILETHLQGVVTSTTALSVGKHFDEAMQIAEKFPTLKIGIHLTLTLTNTKPLLKDKVRSLTQADGTFHQMNDVVEKVNIEEVEAEWRAQIEKFLATNITPTHIDSHHNVHVFSEELHQLALKLAREYKLPLRNSGRDNEDVITTATSDQSFYDEGVTLKQLDKIFSDIANADETYFEVNCHPAFIDSDLRKQTSYLHPRELELDLLRDPKVKDLLVKYNLELTTFDKIKR
ncbi:MAG TPA: carbohydrate deacetylase [Erysipelothrix sp.]|nr:carbohydrate deacetylase [Erysipelothrix sp.]